MLKSYFESSTGHKLESGIKVLIVVQVVFHEVYGLSLNVIDIDPSYTIGEIERKRLLIIKRLEEEGVMEMNKELDFPLVPQRIAVISSKTAAGLGDFLNQLNKSPFYYELKLFEAAMQGKETENSVVHVLEQIFEEEENFDLVVVIRGGGSKSDLAWFDSYKIAVNIAQFPLPILTGIGHERDYTISDLTAHKALTTPTAVAEFLTERMNVFYNVLESLGEGFYTLVEHILSENKNKISKLSNDLKFIVNQIILGETNKISLIQAEYKYKITKVIQQNMFILNEYPEKIKKSIHINIHNKLQFVELNTIRLQNSVKQFFGNEKHRLAMAEQRNILSDPVHILKSGYSYTLAKGCLIKSADEVKNGDLIETILFDGTIRSEVKK